MSKTILEEFFDFFNNLLVGYSKEDTDDNISTLLQSESMMEALSLKLSNSMKNFSQTIDFSCNDITVVDNPKYERTNEDALGMQSRSQSGNQQSSGQRHKSPLHQLRYHHSSRF